MTTTSKTPVAAPFMHANMNVKAVVIIGEDEYGPRMFSFGQGGNPLAMMGTPMTSVLPPAATPPAPKAAVVEPVTPAAPQTPPAAASKPEQTGEHAMLLAEAKRVGLKRKGLHFCKPDTLRVLIAEHKAKNGTPPAAEKPAPQTPPAPPAAKPAASAAPKNPARRGGGKPAAKGNELAVWLPLSQCCGTGTYQCKGNGGETTVARDVAIWDETRDGRMFLAWITADERPVLDAKGNDTGVRERHAYHDGGKWYVTADNQKFARKN
jgi:hypothetical protein